MDEDIAGEDSGVGDGREILAGSKTCIREDIWCLLVIVRRGSSSAYSYRQVLNMTMVPREKAAIELVQEASWTVLKTCESHSSLEPCSSAPLANLCLIQLQQMSQDLVELQIS